MDIPTGLLILEFLGINKFIMKIKLIIFIIVIIILLMMLFLKKGFSSNEEVYSSIKNNITSTTFQGVVTRKFFDKENHGRETVVLATQNGSKILTDFVYEQKGTFEFIRTGDSLIKEKGTLKFNLKRKDLDTIIQLKLDNLKR